MCECDCYDKDKCEILILPDYIERTGRTICVDNCIVDIVKFLWKNNIYTESCCCSHNGKFGNPSIVIGQDEDPLYVKKLIKEIDDREFDIFQWRLVKY